MFEPANQVSIQNRRRVNFWEKPVRRDDWNKHSNEKTALMEDLIETLMNLP